MGNIKKKQLAYLAPLGTLIEINNVLQGYRDVVNRKDEFEADLRIERILEQIRMSLPHGWVLEVKRQDPPSNEVSVETVKDDEGPRVADMDPSGLFCLALQASVRGTECYGDFLSGHEALGAEWSALIRQAGGALDDLPASMVLLLMACSKVNRAACPGVREDDYVDAVNYLRLSYMAKRAEEATDGS